MATKTKTYTYWSYRTSDSPNEYRSRTEKTLNDPRITHIEKHDVTYTEGEGIEVYVLGEWQPGVIVELKRKRVVVTYRRFQTDVLHTRPFYPTQIRKP
jgi:hypothetical protein